MRALPLFLVAVLLAGCTVGPNYTRPEVTIPERFRGATPATSTATLDAWWSNLDDPVLTDLLQQALRANPTVQIALQRVRQARAVEKGAAALSYPTLGGRATAGRAKTSPVTPVTPITDTYSAGFDASWELDLWGGIKRQQEAARAGTQVSEADLADVQLTLLAEVAAQYIDYRVAQYTEGYTERTIASREETRGIVYQKIKAGLTTDDDGTRADSQLAGARATLAVAQQSKAAAELSLELLGGVQPGDLGAALSGPPRPLKPVPLAAGLPAELLLRRPDIRRDERRAAQAVANVGAAEANRYPSLGLAGTLTAAKVVPLTAWFYPFAIATTLNGVIFDAGALAAQVEQQDAVAAQALLEYERTVRDAVSEVEQKLSAVALGRQVANALTDQARADRETLAIATERYRRGLTTFLDVADAERGVFASELALQQKQGQVALDSISLYKAVGGSWSAPDGTMPALPVVAN
jgi:NodT family efflux transporter outer membrane factor (OMF) lipoprotein